MSENTQLVLSHSVRKRIGPIVHLPGPHGVHGLHVSIRPTWIVNTQIIWTNTLTVAIENKPLTASRRPRTSTPCCRLRVSVREREREREVIYTCQGSLKLPSKAHHCEKHWRSTAPSWRSGLDNWHNIDGLSSLQQLTFLCFYLYAPVLRLGVKSPHTFN